MQVTLVGHYGDDLLVTNAARVSFAKKHAAFVTGDHAGSDERLVQYLARENHFMPFCHPHITLHIKAPIFVARQLAKHQIGGSWSEVSRRYVDSEPEFWFPEVWRGRPEGSMKQGSSGVVDINDMNLLALVDELNDIYSEMLERGVAPEQARMILPLNTMTEWYWTGSLMFFARVCQLRLDPHAQAETSEIAQHISDVAATFFPVSWAALIEK
jgi:thymidylate synthase (FAD)